jgi:hypothetical protein
MHNRFSSPATSSSAEMVGVLLPLLKRFKRCIHDFYRPITRVPRSMEKNLGRRRRAFHRPIPLTPRSVNKKLALGCRASTTARENFLTRP